MPQIDKDGRAAAAAVCDKPRQGKLLFCKTFSILYGPKMLRGMPHLPATAASASCHLFMTATRDAREMLLLELLWGLTKHIRFICNINQTVRIIYTHVFVIDPPPPPLLPRDSRKQAMNND